jgi:acyl carrier protein
VLRENIVPAHHRAGKWRLFAAFYPSINAGSSSAGGFPFGLRSKAPTAQPTRLGVGTGLRSAFSRRWLAFAEGAGQGSRWSFLRARCRYRDTKALWPKTAKNGYLSRELQTSDRVPQGEWTMFSRETIRQKLIQFVENETGEPCSALDDGLALREELGLDSVDVVGLVMQVERQFRIRLSSEELERLVKVGDLLNLLEAKLATQPEAAAA